MLGSSIFEEQDAEGDIVEPVQLCTGYVAITIFIPR
jgi:hypothetical protein